jgi:spore coat polysaccharide biosynthesis protein SpsF
MGSTRLPGKVLMRIAGKTALEWVVQRVRMAEEIRGIVVATSDLERDDPICELCDYLHVDWYRGSEQDVLSRYLEAADYFGADPVIRVTSDCPLIDPGVLNALVRAYHANPGCFVTNNLEPTFPHGLDAEVFPLSLLRQATQQTGDDYDAEHVTQWMRKQPGAVNLTCPVDLHQVRITLDTRDDLSLIRAIYRALGSLPYVSTADALDLIQRRPELARLAREVVA